MHLPLHACQMLTQNLLWLAQQHLTHTRICIVGTPLYPYGMYEGDDDYPPSDDSCLKSYSETITVFGEQRNTIYVSDYF